MHPKKFFDSATLKIENGTCFVIMPFADEFTEVYKTICKAVQDPSLNFICRRADDIRRGGNIMQDILESIGKSEFVVADLTGRNANVFYELGIVHTVKEVEKVIILLRENEEVPFDLTPFRNIKYSIEAEGAKGLKSKLITLINEVVGPFRFQVEEGKTFIFPEKLIGTDDYLYDFKLLVTLGGSCAEIELRVTRYAVGEAPEEVPAAKYGLSVGESLKINEIPWDLHMERSYGSVATFRLIPARV